MTPRTLTVTALAATLTLSLVPATACAQMPGLDPVGSSGIQGSSVPASLDPAGSVIPPLPGGPRVETRALLSGLSLPWDVSTDPSGTVVTGERSTGRVLARTPAGAVSEFPLDLPGLVTGGESGLMSLVPAVDFATSRTVYTCHSQSAEGRDNRVTAWRASPGWTGMTRLRTVLTGIPLDPSGYHSGCRVLPAADGTLYIGTGDSKIGTGPYDPASLAGKVLHVRPDGTPASDAAANGVLTRGHRNVQGLAFRPGSDALYSAEHGPDVDDEINRLIPGADYGWDPTRGGGYDQSVPMTDTARHPGARAAVWSSGRPTLATADIEFLLGSGWDRWEGALAVAALKAQKIVLVRLSPDGNEVEETAEILVGTHGRLRSLASRPDGALLITTSDGGGRDEVLSLRPS